MAGFAAAAVLLVLGACSGCSSTPAPKPAPTSAATLDSCAWTSAAIHAAGRAIVVTEAEATYKLVDASSGRVLRRCRTTDNEPVGSFTAAYQSPTYRGRASTASSLVEFWFGGFRPGGPDGTVVATSGGTLDLATGRRVPVEVAGFVPAAVGRSSLVMVRESRTHSKFPPARSRDWCVVSLSGRGDCAAVPRASVPGTPVITRDGSVAWLRTELTPTGVFTRLGDRRAQLFVRTGHGLVTDTAFIYPEGIPGSFEGERVSTDGRAFLYVPATLRSDFESSDPVTWYTVDDTGDRSVHRSSAAYLEVGRLVDAERTLPLLSDTSVSADGRTLFLLVFHDTGTALVAVRQGGDAQVVFDTRHGGDSDRWISLSDHFVTPLSDGSD